MLHFRTAVAIGLATLALASATLTGYLYAQGFDVMAAVINTLRPHGDPVQQNPSLEKLVDYKVSWVGNISNFEINESSGLTASQLEPDRLWTLNDSGNEPFLYALDLQGNSIGRVKIAVRAIDWESMDSVTLAGTPLLMIADTGDNFRWRDSVWLHFVTEPRTLDSASAESTPLTTELKVHHSIEVTYPDGPRDSEAVAIDADRNRILLLSKRHRPPELYAVPLDADGQARAVKIAEFHSLPRHTIEEFERFPKNAPSLHMPSGMDVHGDRLLITTYHNAFLYDLANLAAPLQVDMPRIGQREAITFSTHGDRAFLTRERVAHGFEAEILQIQFNWSAAHINNLAPLTSDQ